MIVRPVYYYKKLIYQIYRVIILYDGLTDEQRRRFAEIAYVLSKSDGAAAAGYNNKMTDTDRKMNMLMEEKKEGIYTYHLFDYYIVDTTDILKTTGDYHNISFTQDHHDSYFLMCIVPDLDLKLLYGHTYKNITKYLTETMIPNKLLSENVGLDDHERWTKYCNPQSGIELLIKSKQNALKGITYCQGFPLVKAGVMSIKCDVCERNYQRLMRGYSPYIPSSD